MKKYLKYLFITTIVSFCFSYVDDVCAVSDNLEPNNATFRMSFCESTGGCQTSSNFSLTKPSYPIFDNFWLIYSSETKPGQPLHSSKYMCHKTSFRIKAPEDARTFQNYNNLNYWSYSNDTFVIRYLDFRHNGGYYYYDFYVQAKNEITEYSLISEKFTYKGSVNPYITSYDYSSNAEWIETKFVHCDSISDVITSNDFDKVNDRIDDIESSINSNIDDLKEKQEEQNQTSKGIWATLIEGIGNIGKWFTDLASSIGNFFKELGESIANGFTSLFDSIKSLFVGEEVCEATKENLFTGYDKVCETGKGCKDEKLIPDSNGWITLSYTGSSIKNWNADKRIDLVNDQFYNVFIEIESATNTGGNVIFGPTNNGQLGNIGAGFRFNSNQSNYVVSNTNITTKGNIHNLKMKFYENQSFFTQGIIQRYVSGTTTIKFRMLITDDMSITLENYEYYNKKEECTTKGGLFGILDTFMSNIGKWFSDLLTGLLDGIKSLFVPDDDQLYEIIDESSALTENFGFVGESVNFFITIFTSLLGLVNHNGCVELPEFSIGETSLFDSHKFWDKQNVCLNDNTILSSNIDTIRTITSIVLVCMFINFAASKFFTILSKNDTGTNVNLTRKEQ